MRLVTSTARYSWQFFSADVSLRAGFKGFVVGYGRGYQASFQSVHDGSSAAARAVRRLAREHLGHLRRGAARRSPAGQRLRGDRARLAPGWPAGLPGRFRRPALRARPAQDHLGRPRSLSRAALCDRRPGRRGRRPRARVARRRRPDPRSHPVEHHPGGAIGHRRHRRAARDARPGAAGAGRPARPDPARRQRHGRPARRLHALAGGASRQT